MSEPKANSFIIIRKCVMYAQPTTISPIANPKRVTVCNGSSFRLLPCLVSSVLSICGTDYIPIGYCVMSDIFFLLLRCVVVL